MFDASPAPAHSPPSGGNDARDATPQGERHYNLIAHWRGKRSALHRTVLLATDWGPHELIETTALNDRAGGAQRFACRFVYHGAENSKAHFESNLRHILREIAVWEEAPKTASHK